MIDHIKDRLYMDIETIPQERFRPETPSPEDCQVEPKPPAKNLKDPEKIKAAIEKNEATAKEQSLEAYGKAVAETEKKFRKYALYGFKSQICSISWAWNDQKPQHTAGTDERYILDTFFKAIYTWKTEDRRSEQEKYESERMQCKPNINNPFMWVGHNIKGFDLKVLKARAMVLGCVPKTFDIPHNERPWNNNTVIDTMDEIPFTNNDRKSLSSICDVLDIPGKLSGVSGSDVYDLYCIGDFKTIGAYNDSDVVAVRNICKRLGI